MYIKLTPCPAFEGIAALLDKNADTGILVMGTQVTFADLVVASVLESIFIAVPDEWEERVKHWDGGRWEKLRDHCGKWRSLH